MSESLSLVTGQRMPDRTDTEAYVGNSVATVYMSFDRNDLTDEGLARLGEGEGSRFIVNSGTEDALITSFRCDFLAGTKKKGTYSVELINPTTQFESRLLSIYDFVFPKDNATFAELCARENELRDMQGTGDADLDKPITWKDVEPKMPIIFLRFGYGDKVTGGTSRILKTKVSNLSYSINANQDKVVELMLMDTFTYWNSSKAFNSRAGVKKVSVINETHANASNATLKLPSQVLKEAIGSFASLYPGLIPWVSLGGADNYSEAFDSMVFGLAARLSDDPNATLEPQQGPGLPGQAELSKGDREDIEKLLSRPINEAIDLNFRKTGPTGEGGISLEILIQAYELAFKQLNLGWEFGKTVLPVDTLNSLSEQQNNSYSDLVDNETDAYQQSNPDMARQLSEVRRQDSEEVNLVEDITETLPDAPGPGWYSFWPKTLGEKPRSRDLFSSKGTISAPGVSKQVIRYKDDLTGDYNEVETFKVDFIGGNAFEIGCVSAGNSAGKMWFDEPGGTTTYRGMELMFSGVGGMPQMQSWVGYIYVDGNSGQSTMLENTNGKTLGGKHTSGILLVKASPEEGAPSESLLRPIDTAIDDFAWFSEIWDPTDVQPGKFVEEASFVPGGENTGPSEVRPLTVAEKHKSSEGGKAPIWIKPGVWNKGKKSPPNTYPPQFGGTSAREGFRSPYQINNIPSLANGNAATFSIKELNELTPANTWQEAKTAYSDPESSPGVGNLPFMDVILPVSDNQAHPKRGKIEGKYGTTDMGYAPLYRGHSSDFILDGVIGKVPLLRSSGGSLELVDGWLTDAALGWVKNPLVQESEEVLSWQESSCDPDALGRVTTSLQLEPTLETWKALMLATTDLNKTGDEIEEEHEMPENTGEKPPKADKISDPPELNGFVVIGTQGAQPDITGVLTNLVDAINNVVLGNANKLVMSELDLSMLGPDEFDYVMGSVLPSLPAPQLEDLNRARPTLLCIAPEDEINDKAFAKLKAPIFSFPEITTREQDLENTTGELNELIYLNYGGPNSIITDIRFAADLRVIVQMKAVFEAIHGQARLDNLGNTKSISLQAIATAVKNDITTYKVDQTEVVTTRSAATYWHGVKKTVVTAKAGSEKTKGFTDEETELLKIINHNDGGLSSEFIPLPLAEYFVTLQFDPDSDEGRAVTFLDIALGSKEIMDYFEEDDMSTGIFYATKEERETITMYGTTDKFDRTTRQEVVTVEASQTVGRFVNFTSIWGKMKKMVPKIIDTKRSFLQAMRQQTWEVEIQTLGIPELCNPNIDLGGVGRKIVLTVFDVRAQETNTPHWVSGAYLIMGMNHEISPTGGFISTFKLFKTKDVHPAFSSRMEQEE